MKIIIAGGTGQVGRMLTRAFAGADHEVWTLTRSNPSAGQHLMITWDGKSLGPWAKALEGADVLINLAGRSVNCRYNDTNRLEIINSRIKSTRVLGNALSQMSNPPKVWLQASTATIYAHTFGPPNDEFTGTIGGNEPNVPETWKFSIDVAQAWENAFNETPLQNTRKVLLRSSMVMSPDRDGIFDTLLRLVRRGLGGSAGNGRQFVSWIHENDFVRALNWIIDNPDLEGAVNVCSPNPLSNAEFMRALRDAAGMKFGLPASKWMLEVGAVFMRTETELILKSRKVVPGKLLRSGFSFEYPEWSTAAKELCSRRM
jgi:hypothetical protein